MPSDAPATKADIESVVLLIQQLAERFDHRFDAIDRQFEGMNRQFEALGKRVDKLGDAMAGMQLQMAAMTRWSERTDRDQLNILSTQTSQQRAIDDLAGRVTRLEQRQN